MYGLNINSAVLSSAANNHHLEGLKIHNFMGSTPDQLNLNPSAGRVVTPRYTVYNIKPGKEAVLSPQLLHLRPVVSQCPLRLFLNYLICQFEVCFIGVQYFKNSVLLSKFLQITVYSLKLDTS